MNEEHDIETRLRRFTGPSPRPETLTAIHARMDLEKSSGARGGRILRLAVPLAAAAALALWAVLFGPFQSDPPLPAGSVVAGTVHIGRGGNTLDLPSGAPLYAGDRLRAGSRADLLLRDGSRVRMAAKTELLLSLSEAGTRARLDLSSGRLFLRVSKGKGRFVVNGPEATVEVLGTVFGVTADAKGTTASVFEGRVRVTESESGSAEELTRGQAARAVKGRGVTRLTEDPADRLLWARRWTRFDDRPLGEVLDWIEANSPLRIDAPKGVRAQRVTISIDREPMERVVQTLMISSALDYTQNGNEIQIEE